MNLDFDFIVQSYFPVQCMSLLVPYHVLLLSHTTDVIHCEIFSGLISFVISSPSG